MMKWLLGKEVISVFSLQNLRLRPFSRFLSQTDGGQSEACSLVQHANSVFFATSKVSA